MSGFSFLFSLFRFVLPFHSLQTEQIRREKKPTAHPDSSWFLGNEENPKTWKISLRFTGDFVPLCPFVSSCFPFPYNVMKWKREGNGKKKETKAHNRIWVLCVLFLFPFHSLHAYTSFHYKWVKRKGNKEQRGMKKEEERTNGNEWLERKEARIRSHFSLHFIHILFISYLQLHLCFLDRTVPFHSVSLFSFPFYSVHAFVPFLPLHYNRIKEKRKEN